MNTKCNDIGCQRHIQCERFTAQDEPAQKYFKITPRWNGQECDVYFPNGLKSKAEEREDQNESIKEHLADISMH